MNPFIDAPDPIRTLTVDTPITDKKEAAMIAANAASIRRTIDPSKGLDEYFLETQQELETAPMEEVTDRITYEYNSYYNSILQSVVEDTITEDSEVIQDYIAVTKEDEEILASPASLEHTNILAHKGVINRVQAEQAYYARTISSIIEETPFMSTLLNYTELFLMLDQPLDVASLVEKYGIDPSLNPFDDLKHIILDFRSRPIEERLLLWEQLKGDVIESTKDFGTVNEHKAALLLMEFLNPHFSSDLDVAAGFNAVDYATVGMAAIAKLVKTAKSANAIRRIADAGDIEGAARASVASASDRVVAEALQQDPIVSAANLSPFSYKEIMPEAADGVNVAAQKLADELIAARRAKTQAELEPLVSGKGYLKESALTETEISLMKEKEFQTIKQLKDDYYEQQGWYVTNAQITKSDEQGFTVSYKLEGVEQTKEVRYNRNDAGELDVLESGIIRNKLSSPEVVIDAILKDAVEVASRMNFAQGQVLQYLSDAARASRKGLTPSQRTRVDDVLLTMDDANKGEGKLYTPAQLMDGAAGGVKLTPKEVSSVYAQRDIFDYLHYEKNAQKRSQLDFDNYKEVDVSENISGASNKTIAKPVAITQLPSDIRSAGTKVWDTRLSGKIKAGSRIDFKEAYENGYTVVVSKDPFLIKNKKFTYALVKTDNITDLPAQVLHYKEAYVPKIMDRAWYFVKSAKNDIVNGKVVPAGQVVTHGRFSSKGEADTFRDVQQAIADAEGKKVNYSSIPDRQLTDAERDNEIVSSFGGLYTSPRATHEIKNSKDVTRVSAHEAMQRNLQHISNTLPMNEWRMGMVQRWLNSAKPFIDPKDWHKGINAPLDPARAQPGTKQHTALTAMQTWVRDQLHMPTDDEISWANGMRRAAEWMEGKPLLKGSPRRGVMNLASSDPFSAMRASAFHTLLGWFNPAQLWVQAQGAAVALSLDPLAAPDRLRRLTALRMAYFVRKNPVAVSRTAKAMLMEPQELQDILAQLEKTGLFQSIRANADYNAAAQGYHVGRDAIARAANIGLVFYTEGERFNRGYAFLTARDFWLKERKAAGLSTVIDDDVLKQILSRTTKKMLNLTRANRAHWQKGAWSVPTQFMQITAKGFEAMLPNIFPGSSKKFSQAEKNKILIGQLALYGGAGIPFGTAIISNIMEQAGVKPNQVPEEWATFATDGAWGSIALMLFDERFALGERGAVLSGAEHLVEKLLLDEAPPKEVAFGAFYTIPNRAFQGLGAIGSIITSPEDIEFTAEEYLTFQHSFGDIFSGYRGAHQAWDWYQHGQLRDTKGIRIMDIDVNNDSAAIWGRAFGIQPRKLTDHYERINWIKKRSEIYSEKATAYRKALSMYITPDIPTPDAKRLFEMAKVKIFNGIDPTKARDIQHKVLKGIIQEDDEWSKTKRNVLKSWLADPTDTSGFGREILLKEGMEKR